jgi:hypothetical protein
VEDFVENGRGLEWWEAKFGVKVLRKFEGIPVSIAGLPSILTG